RPAFACCGPGAATMASCGVTLSESAGVDLAEAGQGLAGPLFLGLSDLRPEPAPDDAHEDANRVDVPDAIRPDGGREPLPREDSCPHVRVSLTKISDRRRSDGKDSS